MTRRFPRRSTSPAITLSADIVTRLHGLLPRVGEDVVAAIIDEVPSYQDALAGPMGGTIRTAVGVALGGFLASASGQGAESLPATPEALEGAYELGRGEARSGWNRSR